MTEPVDSKQTTSADPYQAVSEGAVLGMRETVWGIFLSILLATIKLVTGVLGNSYALVADGVESLLDVFSALVVWASLRVAARPPNLRYPYGFGRIESLATLVVGIVLALAAVGIALRSIQEIRFPHHAPEPYTLIVLVLVVVTKEVMYRRLHSAGRTIGSQAVQADAWHHRSDALTSLAAMVGIAVSLLAGEGYESADDWAALLACIIIGFNGGRLIRSALAEIMDVAVEPKIEDRVREIAREVPEVLALDKCLVRRSGLALFVDLHVIVASEISVRQGHAIGHRVKDRLLESELPIVDVSVHIEPGDENGTVVY